MIQGVQVIVINDNDEILIAKRSPLKSNGDPRVGANRWNFIGGKIDNAETPYQAVIRESREEASISFSVIAEIWEKINYWDLEYDPFNAFLFVAITSYPEKVKLNDEHTEFSWVNLEDLPKYDLLGYTQREVESAMVIFNKQRGII